MSAPSGPGCRPSGGARPAGRRGRGVRVAKRSRLDNAPDQPQQWSDPLRVYCRPGVLKAGALRGASMAAYAPELQRRGIANGVSGAGAELADDGADLWPGARCWACPPFGPALRPPAHWRSPSTSLICSPRSRSAEPLAARIGPASDPRSRASVSQSYQSAQAGIHSLFHLLCTNRHAECHK